MSLIYTPFQPILTQTGLSKFGLSLKLQAPCDELRHVVQAYLQINAHRQTLYPVMPDGTQAVFMSAEGAMIGGAQSAAIDLPLLHPGEYFGIWFRPGALRYFFDLDLSDISNQFVDKEYFACLRFPRLHLDIYGLHSFGERAALCENWLLSRFSHNPIPKFDQALSLIYQSKGNARIGELAAKVGWSGRHLNRQFLQHTGLTTKDFSQIIRVQHVCQQLYIKQTGGQDTSIAPGFYDQSHQIKHFKKYFNASPGLFFNRFMSDFYNQ